MKCCLRSCNHRLEVDGSQGLLIMWMLMQSCLHQHLKKMSPVCYSVSLSNMSFFSSLCTNCSNMVVNIWTHLHLIGNVLKKPHVLRSLFSGFYLPLSFCEQVIDWRPQRVYPASNLVTAGAGVSPTSHPMALNWIL